MPKNVKGQLSVGQKIISIIISVGTAILHAVLVKKGISIPMDELINPVSTGGAAGAIAGLIFKASGKPESK